MWLRQQYNSDVLVDDLSEQKLVSVVNRAEQEPDLFKEHVLELVPWFNKLTGGVPCVSSTIHEF